MILLDDTRVPDRNRCKGRHGGCKNIAEFRYHGETSGHYVFCWTCASHEDGRQQAA